MSIRNCSRMVLLCCTLGFGFTACQKSNTDLSAHPDATPGANARAGGTAALKETPFYALTATNELVGYLSGNPLKETSVQAISGLGAGEKLLAIDFRPATGQLYGVSNASKLYTIQTGTGVATAVGGPFTPAISGTEVGFDFNPTVDRIRLVTNTGQNLRLNPITGTVAAVDGNINPMGASITAVAYTNSFAGATSTTLYDIDVASDKLFIQNPPNNGTLVPVGSLGVQAAGEAGFDIAPDNSVAIAAFYSRGSENARPAQSRGIKSRFYYIDLASGKAKNAGQTNRTIIGLAIPAL